MDMEFIMRNLNWARAVLEENKVKGKPKNAWLEGFKFANEKIVEHENAKGDICLTK